MIILFLLIFFISLIFEAFAVYSLFYVFEFGKGILHFFAFYFIAVFLLAISIYPVVKSKFNNNFLKPITFVTLLSFFVPVFGYFLAIIFAVITAFLIREKPVIKTDNIPVEEFITEEVNLKKISFGEGFLKKVVENKDVGIPVKEEAILILSYMKNPLSVHLLKEATYSDFDEVRLLALNFLSNVEKELNQKISYLFKRIKETKEPYIAAELLREIAFLYWEFVYLGIGDKEFNQYYLKQALDSTLSALEVLHEDDKLLFLLGRIYLRLGEIEKAEEALKKAILFNPGNSSAHIYLAEVEFIKGKYSQVKQILQKVKNVEREYLSYAIVSLWRK